jgi:neopullulanase
LRIVLDGVFNHASRGFYQFNHLLENGPTSPYLDWFHVIGWPLHAYDGNRSPNYAAWWDIHALPKLNTRNPAVREFILDVAEYWVTEGIDGWRLDVPSEIDDDEFWREFRRRVKRANPEAYIVGEIWGDAQRWLQGDQFDAVMNYPITRACLGFFARETLDNNIALGTGYGHIDRLDGAGFAAFITAILTRYPAEIAQAQMNLLGSHDTPRFATLARGDGEAFRLALLFLMTFPGAPCIYYGDEIAMEGGRDPECRRGFPWQDEDHGGSAEQWDEEVLDYARRTIALRRNHPVLSLGSFTILHTSGDLVVYARHWEGQTCIVALNAGKKGRRLEVPVSGFAADGSVFDAIWGKGKARVRNGVLGGANVPARSGIVLLRQA